MHGVISILNGLVFTRSVGVFLRLIFKANRQSNINRKKALLVVSDFCDLDSSNAHACLMDGGRVSYCLSAIGTKDEVKRSKEPTAKGQGPEGSLTSSVISSWFLTAPKPCMHDAPGLDTSTM